MKRLKYHRLLTHDIGTPQHPKTETYLQEEFLYANASNYDVQMSAATKVAHNGEVTVEIVPDVPTPPTAQELAAENKLLHQQVVALTDRGDFQEELIVELANIVYA